ncbi:MAG: hypothetical protein RLZZ436_1749 [Planctomycetota bacterium]
MSEAHRIVTLAVKSALSRESADEAFATEEAADEAGAGFNDLKLHGVFKGDDVAGINGVLTVDFHLVDGPEAGQKNLALSLSFDPESVFAAEEGLSQSLPGGIDTDSRGAGEPAGALNQQRSSAKPMVHDVTLERWSENQSLISCAGCEVIKKEIFTGKHPLDTAQQPSGFALHCGTGLHTESFGHGDHGSDFAGDAFTGVHAQSED